MTAFCRPAEQHVVHAREIVLLGQHQQTGADALAGRIERAAMRGIQFGHFLDQLREQAMVRMRGVQQRAGHFNRRRRRLIAGAVTLAMVLGLALGHRVMGFDIQIAARERRGNALDFRQVEQHRELAQVAAAIQRRRQRMQAGIVQRGPDEITATVDGGRAIHIEFELSRFLREITQAAVVLLGDFQGTAVVRVQMLVGIVVAHLRVLRTRGGFARRVARWCEAIAVGLVARGHLQVHMAARRGTSALQWGAGGGQIKGCGVACCLLHACSALMGAAVLAG
ncbi:hypothetical protein FLFIOBJN_04043 [Stenotrophomonas maltophilia]|nr:hypothetical protein FLFIOBJN_04043 [Stenotrophomonas maltophilia]